MSYNARHEDVAKRLRELCADGKLKGFMYRSRGDGLLIWRISFRDGEELDMQTHEAEKFLKGVELYRDKTNWDTYIP